MILGFDAEGWLMWGLVLRLVCTAGDLETLVVEAWLMVAS